MQKIDFFFNFSGFLSTKLRFLYYTPQLQNTEKYSKSVQKSRETIQRVTEHPFFHQSLKKTRSYQEYSAFYDKKCWKNDFFCNFSGFLGSKPTFLYYTPQLQNTEKCSKTVQKCRENIQRVTEHPFLYLVKETWSYHNYRAFHDKICKKTLFFLHF